MLIKTAFGNSHCASLIYWWNIVMIVIKILNQLGLKVSDKCRVYRNIIITEETGLINQQ